MAHANFKDDAKLLGGDRAKVGGPLVWGQDDTGALIYAMVCQSIGHDNTVGREVAPLELTPGATRMGNRGPALLRGAFRRGHGSRHRPRHLYEHRGRVRQLQLDGLRPSELGDGALGDRARGHGRVVADS